MDLHEVYRNSGLGKWFHGESANKTPGWDRYDSEGKLVGECGDAKKGEAYSACLSKQKAAKLGKEGIGNFVKRKRAAQSAAGRGEKGSGAKGKKPINVDTGASKMNESLNIINESRNKPNDPEKWSACKSAAKSKFDVYPSAYANAWAAKCYKKKGGTWSTVKEETEMDNTIKSIQELTKQNIVSNLLEGKMKGGPGKASQRPKSWNKGTKSGSETRKMREEGKREAREMNEEAEQFDPVKAFDSHIRATRNLLNPDARGKMPSEFYTTLVNKGVPHEEAVERTKNMYSLHPPVQRTRQSTYRGDYVRLRDPNTGESRRIAGHDAYDAMKDGFYESVQHRLRKILDEGKEVSPEEAMAHEIPEPHPDYNPMGTPENADEILAADRSPENHAKELNHQISLQMHGHHGSVGALVDLVSKGVLTPEEGIKRIADNHRQTAQENKRLYDEFHRTITGKS